MSPERISLRDNPSDPNLLPGVARGEVGILLCRSSADALTLALQMACSTVLGRPVGSTRTEVRRDPSSVEPVAVLLTNHSSASAAKVLQPIIKVLTPAEIAKLDSLAGLSLLPQGGVDTRILVGDAAKGETQVGPWIETLRQVATRYPLVIIDSLANISGHSLSDAVWVQEVMHTLTQVARRANSTILVLHTGVSQDSTNLLLRAEGAGAITKGVAATLILDQLVLPTQDRIAQASTSLRSLGMGSSIATYLRTPVEPDTRVPESAEAPKQWYLYSRDETTDKMRFFTAVEPSPESGLWSSLPSAIPGVTMPQQLAGVI